MRLVPINKNRYRVPPRWAGLRGIFITGLLLLLAVGQATAESNTQALWQEAARYYSQKKYDSSAAIYQQLLRQDVAPATVYYNLGNVYYRKGSIASAILYYRKALALNPKDKDAADNLALAQTKIEHRLTPLQPVFFIRWWNGLVQLLPAAYWAGITLLLFIGLLGYVYYVKTKGKVPHYGRWLSFFVTVLVLSALLLFAAHRAVTRDDLAVVMQENAPLFHEAASIGTSISVPAGTTVVIQRTKPGYYRVQLPNGAEGWMPQDFLTKVSVKL